MRRIRRSIILGSHVFACPLILAIQLQAQTYTSQIIGGRVIDLNEKGEYIYTITDGGFRLHLPDSAYGLPAGPTTLRALDGSNSVNLRAINDSGIVVGLSQADSGPWHLTVWVNGEPTDKEPPNSIRTEAYDINNLGHIIGSITTNIVSRGFFYDGAQYHDLEPSGFGYDTCFSSWGIARALNNSDVLVGFWQCRPESGISVTANFLWNGTSATELTTSPKVTGLSINDNGQIYGHTDLRPNFDMGVLDPVTGVVTVMPQFGGNTILTEGGGLRSLNDSRQAVGSGIILSEDSQLRMAFIWLPGVAYGLAANVYDLNNLVELPTHDLIHAYAIDNSGQIAVGGINLSTVDTLSGTFELDYFLLTPNASPAIVVNSTGDGADANPGDGICVTSSGDCTLRAAIEEANALAGLDTINFDIPGDEIPVIKPATGLPEITDSVVIVGSTQPSAGRVEINGSAALSADGLVISAGNSVIRNLLINNFAGNGLVLLTGGNNTIGNLSIGVGPDGTEDRGNDGHGIIIINSSNNKIGDPVLSRRNTIAYNDQIGVFVASGTGNSIRNNIIFANSGLGIDLAPIGVTPNDEGDADGGANGLQNSPVIDSVEVDLVTTIRGSISSAGNQSYDIDIYLNDACDASGYGEGKALIQSAPIFVGASGKADFAIQAIVTPALGQYITATATDQNGNTSEFSPCVGANILRLVDEFDFPLANKTFALFRVANDPPIFSETFIDNVTTDDAGLVDIAFPLLTDGVQIRFAKQLSSTLSPKRNATPKSALSVNLDNARFDSASSKMSYTEVSNMMVRSEFIKKVKMTHTTVAINLYVSIEFDVSVAYHNNLKNAFRLASNYLYDVTDGQVRLDTVIISDNGVGWNVADVWIHASNLEWPRATLNGIAKSGKWDRFYMPRKFYGDSTTNRNQSVVEHPLNTATPNSYRTFIHELGHYALGLGDEYVYNTPPVKCPTVASYGFMQNQYPGGAPNSEMSVNSMYTIGVCQNTDHWVSTMSSCWKHLENTYQKTYDGILAPIIMPDERNLPGGQTFLLGPNDNLASLDVNVGAKIVFPLTHGGPVIPSQLLIFVRRDGVTPAGNIRVDQIFTSPPRRIRQGNTADNGLARFMGASSEWGYSVSGSKAVGLEPATVIDTADRRHYFISISESTKKQARLRPKEPTLNDEPLGEKSFNHIEY